jgi:Leucine-rich repeat (LRR) protein
MLAHTASNLKNLSIKNFKIHKLPPNFSNFFALKSLDISLNRFAKIPESIRTLPNLSSLSLQGNPLVLDGSPFVSNPTLDIRDISVKELPDSINTIHFFGYQFETLIPFVQHSSIHTLIIEDFEENPSFTGALLNVSKIKVTSALTKSLPSFLIQCPNITSLIWEHGQILHWPDNLYLPKLKHLSLKHNRIAWLSGNIKRHTELKKLDLSHNSLRMIPQSVRSCTQLTSLNVSNCQIRSIGSALGNMKMLKHLDLSGNPLESLSPSLSKQNLQTINICDTKIKDHSNLNNFIDGIDFSIQEKPLITSLVINSAELTCSLRIGNLLRFLPPEKIVEELDLSMQTFTSTTELVELLKKTQPKELRFWKTDFPEQLPEDCPRPNVVYAETSLFSKFPDSWHDILVPPKLYSVHLNNRFTRTTFLSMLIQIHPETFHNGYDIPSHIYLPHGKESEYLDQFSKKEILLLPVDSL